MKRVMLVFIAGAACGFGAATYLSVTDYRSIEKRLALSREQCDTWRDLATEHEVDLRACEQELHTEAKP